MTRRLRRTAQQREQRKPYQQRVLELATSGLLAPGSVAVVNVLHEPNCPQLDGRGPCSCDAEVGLAPTPDWLDEARGATGAPGQTDSAEGGDQ